MARLLSEDEDFKSYLELTPGTVMESGSGAGGEGEAWQYYQLAMGSGERRLEYVTANPGKMEPHSMERSDFAESVNGYLLCRRPKDEVGKFVKALIKLSEEESKKIVFEPLEPSFELSIERQDNHTLRVVLFIDEGNVTTGIARWDALGIRYYTTQSNLLTFIDELKREFSC